MLHIVLIISIIALFVDFDSHILHLDILKLYSIGGGGQIIFVKGCKIRAVTCTWISIAVGGISTWGLLRRDEVSVYSSKFLYREENEFATLQWLIYSYPLGKWGSALRDKTVTWSPLAVFIQFLQLLLSYFITYSTKKLSVFLNSV